MVFDHRGGRGLILGPFPYIFIIFLLVLILLVLLSLLLPLHLGNPSVPLHDDHLGPNVIINTSPLGINLKQIKSNVIFGF